MTTTTTNSKRKGLGRLAPTKIAAERASATIRRPEKLADAEEQKQRLIIARRNHDRPGRRTSGQQQFRVDSMQMPSMITREREHGHQRPTTWRRSGCLAAGGGGGSSRLTRVSGTLSPRVLVIGLLHQIVIVSLILHELPASKATQLSATETSPSDSERATAALKRHLGNNLHSFEQRYSNEFPSIYSAELAPVRLGKGWDSPARTAPAGQKNSSGQHQQQPPSRTKEPREGTTTNGNNQRHEAHSFMKSEIMNDNELMQTARRSAPAAAGETDFRQLRRRAKRHMGPELDEELALAAAANQYVQAPAMTSASKRTAPDCQKLAALWLYLQSSYPMLASHLAEQATGSDAPRAGQLSRSIGHLLDDAERLTAAVMRPQQATMSLAHHRHSPAWLARLSSSSAYGKLVQHLRAQQLNQLGQRQQQPQPQPPPSSPSVVPQEQTHREQPPPQRPPPAVGPDDANGEQMASSMSRPQPVYGRLVNYPHEIGSADNSHGMARTLGKIRLLNHHNKQQRQQQQQLESGDIVTTNKIPLAPADLADRTEADGSKLAESAIDLARGNFVYGTMLLSPSGGTYQDNNNNNKQRSPLVPFNHHHRPMSTLRELANEQEHQRLVQSGASQNQPPPPAKTADSGQSSFSSSSETNYGQILTSPPSDNKHSNNNNDKSDLTQTTNPNGAGATSDELALQQSVGLAAVESGADGGDEFEGVFHSSPLKQVEARLLRSLDQQPPPRPANGPELMQQPQLELAAGKAEFMID